MCDLESSLVGFGGSLPWSLKILAVKCRINFCCIPIDIWKNSAIQLVKSIDWLTLWPNR